jgi:predicted lipoprotein with Yx(FWY)xxD motif
MQTLKVLLTATALGMSACATYSTLPPPPYGAVMVQAASKAPLGAYLVDGRGRALYILEGQRHEAGMDRCMGECLRVWPPVHSSAPPAAGVQANPAMLATTPLHGAVHVTYAGWPLYYYHRDSAPGDTTGQHVTDRWGTWHLLSPAGEPIRPLGSGY